ncbi:MAG: TIM-barrel domain-containing protein [Bacteroidales bacterium]
MRIFLLLILLLGILPTHAQKIERVIQSNDGVELLSAQGKIILTPLDENVVRVKYLADVNIRPLPEFVLKNDFKTPQFIVKESKDSVFFESKKIKVIVYKEHGKIAFADSKGKIFLQEKENSRVIRTSQVGDELCYAVEQTFLTSPDEFLFGLGQFQDGHYNLKGVTRRLIQVNSQIALPFIYSSKGYGLLWHQYGLTDFNPADNGINLEKFETQAGEKAKVTTTSGTQEIAQDQSVYRGSFTVPGDGEYCLFLDLGGMGNRHLVVVDSVSCIDQVNFWLPPSASAIVKLKAGKHNVQVVCKADNSPTLSWRPYSNTTTFCSPVASNLDYIVFYGPDADTVMAAYRKLSGNVPMLPIWAYGFWQCRERYTSGKHLVETVSEFRNRKLPMDVIVQDWQYWGNNGWGVPVFDSVNYSNPSKFIKEIHDLNAHFCISIWSNPDKNSKIGKEFVAKNLYIPDSKWLDYFNAKTREEYWNVLNKNLFVHGVDSWWMDATEPENDDLKGRTTSLGPGEFYRLTYPLMVCKAVYEGQRAINPDKRVCILTRSAFLGQQRYATINWSGDIGGDWDAFKRQITAGLNYTITGLPYWTTDIGGFFRPGHAQYSDEKYHELLIRWFQWGAFNPIFRVHGYQSETEPWKYGEMVEESIRKILNLRYALLPYIYSLAWKVTDQGSTLMRPLVMDFREDNVALMQPYEFMFGKSILVAPVIKAAAKEWNVYLPKSTDWYDFWTGKKLQGGQTITRETPIDIMPLYIKAGSILPIGPAVQYANEKRWDNLQIRVYEGADGEFTLYEDEGDNYNYEKGMYATITFKWDDKKKILTIGKRKGEFPDMLVSRTFSIVKVSNKQGIGMQVEENVGKIVRYDGKEVKIVL